MFKAHRLFYLSTLGSRVINKKKKGCREGKGGGCHPWGRGACIWRLLQAARVAVCLECQTTLPVQGYLAHKKQPPPLGPSYDPT